MSCANKAKKPKVPQLVKIIK